MGFIEIMSMHIQHLTQTHKISLCFEENKHIGETLSILFISLPQISCEKKTNIIADSKGLLVSRVQN